MDKRTEGGKLVKKLKIYKRILLFQVGILATIIIHYFVTQNRGYKAIGGEFLLIPLLYVLHLVGQAINKRWSETNEYFKQKQQASAWKEEGLRDYAN